MAKNKFNKIHLTWILPLIGILIFIGLAVAFKPLQQTTYFNDGNLGIVKTTVIQHNWFSKLWLPFQQAVVFAQEEVNLDDTVQFRDEYLIPFEQLLPGEYITQFEVIIQEDLPVIYGPCRIGYDDCPDGYTCDGNCVPVFSQSIAWGMFSQPYDFYNQPSSGLWITHEWIAHILGTFSARTVYTISTCDIDWLGNIDNCASIFPFKTIVEYSDNTVTVIDSVATTPICNLEPKDREEEDFAITIDNGVAYKTTYEIPNADCSAYITSKITHRVVCDNEYGIDGTTAPTADGAIHTCDKINVEVTDICSTNSDCTLPELCNPLTLGCSISDCSAPVVQECADGSFITLKDCVNNFQISPTVVPKCPVIDTIDPNNILLISKIWIYVEEDAKCTKINASPDINDIISYSTLASCEKANNIEPDKVDYILISIIGGILLLIVILIIVVLKVRRPIAVRY